MTEFGFIDHIKELFSTIPSNGFEGIGDDCAVLPISSDQALLFSSDMLIENIHFLRDKISPHNLGYKSLAVNISDIAAMGGSPVASLLSISLPKSVDPSWAEEFMAGYRELSQKHGVALVGGDTTSSKGDISINVTVIGRANNSNIKRRCDARAGDIILATGQLGDSAAGLRDILEGRLTTPEATIHCRPTPRIEEGAWLGHRPEVGAMMDISDGIASDICHILKSSSVGAIIELDKIPSRFDAQTALCGGEDYELLLTARRENSLELITEFNTLFNIKLTPIGEVIAGEEIIWRKDGKQLDVELMGFRHF